MKKSLRLFSTLRVAAALALALLLPAIGQAATVTTAGSGNWNSTTANAPWPGGTVPATTDDVVIRPGDTVTVTASTTINSIAFGNTAATTGTVSVSSGQTLTVTADITQRNDNNGNTSGALAGAGTITCASVTVGRTTAITADGTTTLTSTISTLTISGNLNIRSDDGGSGNDNDATFALQSGSVSVGGSVDLDSDNSNSSVATLTMQTGAQSGTLTLSGASPFISSNTGGTETFSVNGTGATLVYSGAAQTVRSGTYNNLTLSGSGAKTTTSVTVNGILSMEGTATASVAPTYGGSATLQYNTATAQTAGPEWITPFAATGGVIITNTGTITLNAAKVFNNTVPLTINSGATLSTSGSNFALTLGGNFTNDGTLTAGSSAITIGTGNATQSIDGFTTTGTVTVNKSGGTATLAGDVGGGALTITAGTLNLGTGLTHTFTGTWTRTAGTLNGGSSRLKLGAGFSGTGGTFTASTGTVEWNGGAQTIAGVTYNNLTLSGSGAKTTTGATVNGILSLEGTATTTGTVATYGAAATLQYKGSAAQTTGTEFPATWSGSGGVIIDNASGVTLGGSKTINAPLTLTSGVLASGANFVGIGTGGSVSGAGSSTYVNGNVRKFFSTGALPASFTFPIGDAASYTPVALSSISVTAAAGSYLEAKTTGVEHPSVSGANLDTAKSVNRYWTFTPSGLTVTSYAAAFNFVAGDVDGGANTANFVIRRFASPDWFLTTTGTRTATSTAATGITSFSDFAIGESGPVNAAPTLDALGNLTLTEDDGAQNVPLAGIGMGGGDTGQTLTVTATSSNTAIIPNPTVTYTSANTGGSIAFTPVANAFGTVTISVKVQDDGLTTLGSTNAVTNTFTVTVSSVNDAPSFAAIGSVTVNEDASAQSVSLTVISSGPANESAQTLSFSATSSDTSIVPTPTFTYTSANTTGTLNFTPAANASGTVTITVTLTDNGGTANSGVNSANQTFAVDVTALNDAPTLDPFGTPVIGVASTNSASSTSSSSSVTFSHNPGTGPSRLLLVTVGLGDDQNTGSAGFVTGVTFGGTAMFLVGSNAPSVNNGIKSFIYGMVSPPSGSANVVVSANQNASFVVGAVTFTNVNQLTPLGTYVGSGSAGDGTSGSVVVSSAAGEVVLSVGAWDDTGTQNITIGGGQTGLWRYVDLNYISSATSFEPGAASVTSSYTSAGVQEWSIGAVAIKPATGYVNISEDASATTVNLAGIGVGGGSNESGQTLVVTASSNDTGLIPNPTVSYTSANATGSISFTPVANANGSATITVTVTDNGGTTGGGVDTVSQTMLVVVYAVNDAPTLDTIASPAAINEDATAQTVNLSGISAGLPANESGQTLTVTATSSSTGLIPNPTVTYTSANATGSISYTPVANANGTATITVTVNDGGGTSLGGVQTVLQTFTVVVNAVNDAPTLNTIGNLAIDEDDGLQTVNLAGIGDGAANETQTLSVTSTSSDTSIIPSPTVSYTSANTTGSIAFTPVANANGTVTITVTVTDNGGTTFGGVDNFSRTFTVAVAAINDAPGFTLNGVAADTTGTNWTARLAAGTRNWRAVASSADGVKLVAVVNGGFIYTSTDSGVTWTQRDSARDWYSVASSSDGTKLVAVEFGGQIRTSANSGATWTARDSARNWYSVASSANGNNLVAVEYNGQVFTSVNSGVNWTARDSNRTWDSVASSSDGVKLVASVDFGLLYTSVNSGVNWTAQDSVRNWSAVASSADGVKLVAVENGGQIYTSTDSGATWTARDSSRNWISVASSDDGVNLVAAEFAGQLYKSADSGVTWTPTDSSRNWFSVASSSDGAKLAAVVNGGQVYTLPGLSLLALNEDAGLQNLSLTGVSSGPANESSQTLVFSATSSDTSIIPTPTFTYTSPGTTGTLDFTPVAHANGAVTITVTVNDGGGTANGGVESATTNFVVNITAVNDAPTLNTLADLTLNEDAGAQTVNLAGIGVGGTGEGAQTLAVTASSSNPGLIPTPTVAYTSADATGSISFTSASNASGTATLTVTVTDTGGTANSGVQTFSRTFSVVINPVNDAPTLNALSTTTVAEDSTVFTVGLSGITAGGGETQNLTVTTASSDTAIIPGPTVIYMSANTTGSITFTPAANANGTVTISVTVTDDGGTAFSGVDAVINTFTVTVTAENDPPTLDALVNLTVGEDAQAQAVNLSGIGAGGGESQTLTVTAASSNTGIVQITAINYTTADTTGSIEFTPVTSASGTVTITVTVTDDATAGGAALATNQTFTVVVTDVNDAPTLNALGNLTVSMDSGLQTVSLLGISMGTGDSGQTITVAAASGNTSVIPNPAVSYTSPNTTGSLGFTPVTAASGTALITVTVTDSGGTTGGGTDTLTRTFLVTVDINDAPTLAPLAGLTLNEDPGAQSVSLTGLTTGGESQTLTITATSSNTSIIPTPSASYGNPNTTGSISFTPTPDASGTVTISVKVQDSGGTGGGGVNAVTNTFSVVINPVNDAPTLTAVSNVTVNEDASAQTISLAGIATGPANESAQAITSFTATSSDTGLIPTVTVNYTTGTTGTLNYTPVANSNGVATITVTLVDDGGTASSGVDTFTRTFTVTVNAVNDVPTLTLGGSVAGEQVLYGAGRSSDLLILNPANGLVTSQVGALGGYRVTGLAAHPTTGVLYGILSSHGRVLVTINTNTGAATVIGGGGGTITDITFAPDGTLYGWKKLVSSFFATTDELVTIDLTTGVATSVGFSGLAFSAQGGGLAADAAGNLFLTPNGDDGELYAVDKTTGVATLVTALDGTLERPIAALAFNASGTLFGVTAGTDGTDDRYLITISTNTGAVTVLGLSDDTGLDAIVFAGGASVATPFTSPLTINEDAGAQTVSLSGISAGLPPNESGQALTVTATSSSTALIPNPTVTYTSANTGGSLSFTPAANANGTVTISVKVQDDGGTSNGGVNAVTNTFAVVVNAVNDAPVFTVNGLTTNTTAQVLYGVNNAFGEGSPVVYQIDPVTGVASGQQTITLAGFDIDRSLALAAQPGSGTLFAVVQETDGGSSSRRLVTINPTTGVATDIGALGGKPFAALAFRANGTLYGATGQGGSNPETLYQISTVNAALTLVMAFTPAADGESIAFAPDGYLYRSSGNGTARFFRVDVDAQTEVDLGTEDDEMFAMGYDASGGRMIGSDSDNNFFSISLVDGTRTPIAGLSGFDGDNRGLAFVSGASTLTLALNEDAGARVLSLTGIGSGAANESQVLTFSAASSDAGLIPTPTFTYTSANTTGRLHFTPAANANGTVTLTVTLTDNGGTANSGVDTTTTSFEVSITAVNDRPTLDALANASFLEDAVAQTVILAGITVGGSDAGQTLSVSATSSDTGIISITTVTYADPDTTGSVTYTPVANGNGTVTISVVVSDTGGTATGGVDAVTNTFQVIVTPVNDAPTLDALISATINEDATAQTASLSGITVGPGNEIGQVLNVFASSSDTFLIPNPVVTYVSPRSTGSLSYAPVANASGTVTITVIVTDGGGTANGGTNAVTNSFTVAVTAVNDAPTLGAIADATVLEDAGAQTVSLFGITVGPASETGQTLTVTASSSNPGLIPNPTVTYASPGFTGSLAYAPVAGSNGVATISVVVTDSGLTANGGVDAKTNTYLVTVEALNDRPTLDALAGLTIAEDAAAQTVNLAGIGSGAANEGQSLTVTAVSSSPGIIPTPAVTYVSPGATGSISFTPVANANGTVTITVTVTDDATAGGAARSTNQTFTVVVNAVNDAPTLNALASLTILEDAGAQTVTLTGISSGPANESSQSLTFTAASSDTSLIPTPTVIYTSGTTGTLNFTPATNVNGTVTITVVLADDGGTASSGVDKATNSFVVNITAVNDAPTLDAIANVTVKDTAGAQTVNLTGIGTGPADENSQTLTVTASSSNPAVIANPTVNYGVSAAPGNPTTGTLTFTPTASVTGTATISVVVTDNGGTASGGVAAVTNTFTIVVTTANVAPTLAAIGNVSISEDSGAQTVSLTGIGMGAGESGQTLTVSATSGNTALIPTPTVTYTSPNTGGSLSFTPAANSIGSALITVTVTDSGGTANGGVNAVTNTFTVTVSPTNDAPTLNAISSVTVLEDSSATTVNLSGIGSGTGESQSLTVTATSGNPGLVPNPTVSYNSANATGSISLAPVANASGTATITVTVTDDATAGGVALATSRTFTVTVTPVNDAPTLNALASVTINEDAGAQPVSLAGIGMGAGDSGQTLTISATSSNPSLIPNLVVLYNSPNTTGRLLFNFPATNTTGSARITVIVSDGGGTANGGVATVTNTFTVTFNAVNDAPTLNALSSVTLLEDAVAQTVSLAGISAGGDETGQTITVTASSSNTSLVPTPVVTYTSGDSFGSLAYTPVANASGTATITVTASDTGGTANGGVAAVTNTFTVTVTSVNDAPTLTAIANVALTEDAGAQTVSLAGIGAGGGESQTLTVTASSSNTALIPTPVVTYTSGATGSLAYTPAANSSGVSTITVTVSDNGGTASGGVDAVVKTFVIVVTAANDAPTLTALTGLTVLEDAGVQTVNLAGLSSGPANESSQTLTVTATSSDTALIPVPSVTYSVGGVTGSLNFTPVANANGTVTIRVIVQDDGGTAGGGADSVTNSFTVTVTAVNDAPTLAAIGSRNLPETTAPQTVNLSGIAAGPANESQTLTFTATSSSTSLIPNPTVNYTSGPTGTLAFTPASGANGTVTITVVLADNGGTASSGRDRVTNSFTVTLTAVNNAPTLSAIGNQTTLEGSLPTTVSLSGISAGPADESGQVVTIAATSGNPSLIQNLSVNYAPGSTTGSVTYTPVANASGPVTVTVVAADNGGRTSGGVDAVTNTFQVFIISLADRTLAVQSAGNTAVVNWSTNALDFQLQSTTNLATTAWSTVGTAPTVVSGRNYVTNSPVTSQRFYRLIRPEVLR